MDNRDQETAGGTSLASRSLSEGHGSSLNEGDIDRRQSVRSIVTLPPYHVAPLPNEELIAREGERAGIDVVVEYPEQEEVLEARREHEMEHLYQIRETRRREEAERNERREQRRRAREAEDWQLLDQLEQDSRNRAQRRAADEDRLTSAIHAAEQSGDPQLAAPSSRQLIAELRSLRENNAHARRVSSVSYADLGLARHDGSRLRADSVDSRDDRPLLDSAASMGGQRSRAVSRAGSEQGSRDGSRAPHTRQLSDGHPSLWSPPAGGSGSHSRRPSQPRFLTPNFSGGSNDAPQQPLQPLQPPDPPSYEDDLSVHGGEAPPYESPVLTRNPELPSHSGSNAETADGELSAAAHIASSYLAHGPSDDGESEGEPIVGGPVQHRSQDSSSNETQGPGEPATARKNPALSRLQTQASVAPAVEVTSATPIDSTPTTPFPGRR